MKEHEDAREEGPNTIDLDLTNGRLNLSLELKLSDLFKTIQLGKSSANNLRIKNFTIHRALEQPTCVVK